MNVCMTKVFKIDHFATVNIYISYSKLRFSCKEPSVIASEPKGGDIHQLIASVPAICATSATTK